MPDFDALILRIREQTYKGKLQRDWEFEDYWSYIYDHFRPGTVLTVEMVTILGMWQRMAYERGEQRDQHTDIH